MGVANGGDGNILSFDPSCDGPNCTATLVWNSTGSNAKSAGAIAYMPEGPPRPEALAITSVTTIVPPFFCTCPLSLGLSCHPSIHSELVFARAAPKFHVQISSIREY